MSSKLEFFYDYVSVYSYLANSQLHTLGESEIVYRPMFLGGVMQATGNRPPASVEAKGRYLAVDVERWARRYAVPLVINPVFPLNTLNALRVAIAAQRRGEFAAVHQPLFDAAWVRRVNLGEPDELFRIVGDAGLPAEEYFDLVGLQDIKDELKKNTEEAVRRGVFGAPTFFVGDQMFFGNDRLDQVREALKRSG